MKIFVATLMIASAATAAVAQNTNAAAPNAVVKAWVAANPATGHGPIKNSPFTADEVNDSVQTLADGNRIVRSSTGKFYRNSEGRIRREGKGGVGGLFGSTYSFGPGVSITSPDMNQKFLLDSKLQTARVVELVQAQKELAIAGSKVLTGAERSEALEKIKADLKMEIRGDHTIVTRSPMAIAPVPSLPPIPATPFLAGQSNGGFAYSFGTQSSKYETRTEELGIRDFEGVSAEGTRKITTIPAGAIGNDREIEIVYERWFSKDLGLVVYSKNTDPRFGEQTYKMTNIVRSEPDPTLFSVPTHYRKVEEKGTVYRVTERATSPRTVSVVPTVSTARQSKP